MSTRSRSKFVLGLIPFVLIALNLATTHAALVLDDPLQGSTVGARAGGAFAADGWQVTGQTDSIYWHVPTITNGAAEFDVRGIYPDECRTGMADKVELFHMYDYTWNNADNSYAPGYRDDPYKHFIRKTDCLDTARVNSMEIVWQISANYTEPDTAQLLWDPSTTYHFREEWGPDGAGNSVLRVYRNGALLLTTAVPGSWNPAGHSIRIAASARRADDFGAPIDAVFSNVKVWDLSSGVPAAPVVSQPANGATINATLVFLQWSGDPHTLYQVRVNRVNDPDSGIEWDSGEASSDRNFAWTGSLSDMTTYYVFVRLGNSGTWGPWSTGGRTFQVNTASVPSGTNVVRVSGKSFVDNSGPFLGLGASYFQALRRAKYDRTRLNSDLALLASKGINYVRILSMVNWDGLEIAPVSFTNSAGHFVAGWPDYWQQFRDMIDLVASNGLRAEVTIFADAQYVMPSKTVRQTHLDGILANIAGREHKLVHLEVANEAWQNGFPGSTGVSDLREFTQYLADRTTVPVAITSYDDTSDSGIISLYSGSAADLATVHFSRDTSTIEGGWLPVRDCYRAGNLPGVPPVTSNEPIGAGSSVSTETDPIKLCAAAVFAYIANLPAYVYHSRAGVFGYVNCCPPSGGEVRFEDTAGINAYQYVRQILPSDLSSWVRNDGLESSAPFTVFCNGQANKYWPDVSSPTSGCDRNIGSAKGKEFVCFPMGILAGGVTLQARQSVSFQVFDPLSGAVVNNLAIGAGGQVTLPQGPGAYILKGTFTGGPSTHTLNVKTATGPITIDGNPTDWNLADFTTKVRAGQGGTGDIALIGYDSGTLYYSGYYTGATLPVNAADHTAKVYSRHDANYLYFLARCDDSDIRYPNGLGTNWANDCVEFYIDPANARGSAAMNNSTSDVQLVIDANNQVNAYVCTPAYTAQVLNGVTSAVARDATGWWLEARIAKTALNPPLPSTGGTLGLDFNFRDNDNNNDPAQTTVYTWSDNSTGGGFPSKIPDKWGSATAALLEVSIDLGSPDILNGMTHPQNADGNTTAVTVGGRSCRQNVNTNVDAYFYFGVSDTFAFQGNKLDFYIVVSYFDTGTGSLVLQYDSNTGNTLPAFYKDGGSVALTGSNTWKEKVFHVTDAYFGNRQNAGADFRIAKGGGGFFYLDLVRVVAPQPPPLLRARAAAGTVVISWPASTVGFVLQSQNALAPANWVDMTNGVVLIGSENTVSTPSSSLSKFFRMRKF